MFSSKKIHTTIGIYLNGDFKVNGVRNEYLKEHISYNKLFRFGRALLVNGKIKYLGYWKKAELKKLIKDKNLKDIKRERCTAPYV